METERDTKIGFDMSFLETYQKLQRMDVIWILIQTKQL